MPPTIFPIGADAYHWGSTAHYQQPKPITLPSRRSCGTLATLCASLLHPLVAAFCHQLISHDNWHGHTKHGASCYVHTQYIMEREHTREPGASPSRPAPAQGFQLPVRIVYNMPIHKTCSACSHCNITVTDDVHYGHKRWAQTWTARTASQTQMVNTAAQTVMLNTVAQAKIMSTAAQPQYWHLSMPSLTENHQTKNRQKWWYIRKQSCAYNLATNKRDLLQSGNSNTTHWYNRYIWKLENNHLSYAAATPRILWQS